LSRHDPHHHAAGGDAPEGTVREYDSVNKIVKMGKILNLAWMEHLDRSAFLPEPATRETHAYPSIDTSL
jgi:hypothetical protein